MGPNTQLLNWCLRTNQTQQNSLPLYTGSIRLKASEELDQQRNERQRERVKENRNNTAGNSEPENTKDLDYLNMLTDDHTKGQSEKQDMSSVLSMSFALPSSSSFYFHSPFLLWRLSICFLLSWGLQMCVLGEVEKIARSNSQHLQIGSAQHGPAWSSVCSVAEFLLSYRAFIPSLSWHQARERISLMKYLNLYVRQEERE